MSFIPDKKGEGIAFVPHSLEEEGQFLRFFPRSVAFASRGYMGGKEVIAHALYVPDLQWVRKDGDICNVGYRNQLGGYIYLRIEYDASKKTWFGEKYVNGPGYPKIGSAFGSAWGPFFTHLTMMGVARSERCEFTIVS